MIPPRFSLRNKTVSAFLAVFLGLFLGVPGNDFGQGASNALSFGQPAQAREWHARDEGWSDRRPAHDADDSLERSGGENIFGKASSTASDMPEGIAMPPHCDNAHFLSDREAFAHQSAPSSGWGVFGEKASSKGRHAKQADKPEHICGVVMKVYRARRSRSGWHGYFLVNLGNSAPIRIVANLDEMQAPAWPWVRPGDQVEVEGRYYYDNPRQQGIDWTHYGTSKSWPWAGFVSVNGQRYQ